MTRGAGPAVLVPTLWIVLGPLGQSVTAAGALGTAAAAVLPAPYGSGAAVFALLYGVPVWGFAMAWLVLAAAITLRTALRAPGGLPFALTWWSFTFPVGTCVTGTIALAERSGAGALRGASVALYALLLVAWLVVAARTVHGTATGRLLRPMAPVAPEPLGTPHGGLAPSSWPGASRCAGRRRRAARPRPRRRPGRRWPRPR